ncbi:GPW/gp25 family protein [Pigmentiphaga sp. CHJ604]|uniref:GPW/gp25 family protein n=1 Tax=Pigmentiphaga sp. CHJ604 TaxID=3081984 RepID=UPI0030D4A0F3
MDRNTGRELSGADHVKQSVTDIIQTAIGTRLMRRPYGSQVPGIVDQPGTPDTLVRLYAAIADGLMRWEPRIKLRAVSLVSLTADGKGVLQIDGTIDDGTVRTVSWAVALGGTA